MIYHSEVFYCFSRTFCDTSNVDHAIKLQLSLKCIYPLALVSNVLFSVKTYKINSAIMKNLTFITFVGGRSLDLIREGVPVELTFSAQLF